MTPGIRIPEAAVKGHVFTTSSIFAVTSTIPLSLNHIYTHIHTNKLYLQQFILVSDRQRHQVIRAKSTASHTGGGGKEW